MAIRKALLNGKTVYAEQGEELRGAAKSFTSHCVLASRTPHGVRGLKSKEDPLELSVAGSHPAWGAWIEVHRCF